ncbi:uncharacterized protein LTR77_005983 [Saxophila tyrrhenica]|uniref:Uncharacterized protein n=1 Tax=Saxophila tyrrhenica TaxID=1690608 RepID=A0AAV9P6K6_9PEZI|nr:hypothetical protein LTR77_005983 [Saxophila tyrrhenica]
MGNSSSQIAPTQTASARTPHGPSTAPTRPATARAATRQLHDDVQRAVKRQRTDDSEEPTQRRRARPQHPNFSSTAPARQEADVQHVSGQAKDIKPRKSEDEIVVNTGVVKEWQSAKKRKHEQVDEQAVPETQAEQPAMISSDQMDLDAQLLQATVSGQESEWTANEDRLSNAPPMPMPKKKRPSQRKRKREADEERTRQQELATEHVPHAEVAQIPADQMQPTKAVTGSGTRVRGLRAVVIDGPRAGDTAEADPMPTPPESPPEQNTQEVQQEAGAAEDDDVEPSAAGPEKQPVVNQKNLKKGGNLAKPNPRRRVTAWLQDGDFAPPPVQGTVSPSPPPQSRRKSARKQAPSSSIAGDVDLDAIPESVGSEKSAPRASGKTEKKVKKRKASAADDHRQPEAPTATADDQDEVQARVQSTTRGMVTGAWTAEEKAHAELIWNHFITSKDMRDSDLRANTIDWANIGEIKTIMYEAFPGRKIDAIRKFCQRHFTPYTRGPWTAEEDETLRIRYAEMPEQWTNLGDLLFRPPDAVRDRWRSVVKDAGKRQVGPWSVQEESDLKRAVDECCQLVRKQEGMKRKPRDELEAAINWKVVSEKMEFARNEKRCREKWQDMKRAGRATAAVPDNAVEGSAHAPTVSKANAQAAAPTVSGSRESAPVGPSPNKDLPNKLRELEHQYQKLLPGDIYDALKDIVKAMKGDPDKRFTHESTFWSVVASSREGVSKFAGTGGLRRRCYLGALEVYGERRKVKKAQGIVEKAKRMLKIMKQGEEDGDDQLTRAVDGQGRSLVETMKRKTQKKQKPQIKSEEAIVESEDEEPPPPPEAAKDASVLAPATPFCIQHPGPSTGAKKSTSGKLRKLRQKKRKRASSDADGDEYDLGVTVGEQGSPMLKPKQKKRKVKTPVKQHRSAEFVRESDGESSEWPTDDEEERPAGPAEEEKPVREEEPRYRLVDEVTVSSY